MTALIDDLRIALRTLRRAPGFAAACVLTFAVGIGATTSLFSVVDGVILRPLPFANPDDLYFFSEQGRDGAQRLPSYPNFSDYRTEATAFAALGYVVGQSAILRTGDGVTNFALGKVSDGFFQTLAVAPLLGRGLLPEDERPSAAPAAVLTYSFWRSQFAGDPTIIGRTVTTAEGGLTVVGVLPPGVVFPIWAQIYSPLSAGAPPAAMQWRNLHVDGGMIARLAPGADRAQAEAQLAALSHRMAEAYPADNAGFSALLTPLRDTVINGNVRTPLLFLLAATGVVLLIACVNVANLFLARLARRTHELALRSALGAERSRLVTQLLAEAVLLASVGAVIGLVCAALLIRLLATGDSSVAIAVGSFVPRLEELRMDGRIVALAVSLTLASALAAGLVPAWTGSRTDLARVLKQGGARNSGGSGTAGRRLLIGAQSGLALALLIGAGLLLNSLWRVTRVDRGFESAGLLTAHIFPSPRYQAPDSNLPELYRRLVDAVSAVPGVRGVGLVNHLPMGGAWTGSRVSIDGAPIEPGRELTVGVRSVNQPYLDVMRIPLRRGRWFSPGDMRESLTGVVINQAMADKYWPGADPVGRRVAFFKSAAGRADFGQPLSAEVIGVVGDVRQFGLEQASDAALYVPFTAAPWGHTSFTIRTTGDPALLIEPVRRALVAAEPDLVVDGLTPMDLVVSGTLVTRNFLLLLLGGFALTALVLAGIGLYGVLSHLVGERTREIGIRRAIGASEGRIVRQIVSDGMMAVTGGAVAGLTLAWGVGRLLASQLFGVTPTDPFTWLATTLVLLITGLVACYGPARRAARIDPLTALRSE
ncbi:MAG: ABC transporter permease [Gemmatimonadales bacterium]